MTQRKAHVVRVFKDGDTGSSKWVDVLRLDAVPTIQNGGGQVKFFGLNKWKDDSGAGDGKSDNDVHITEQVEVKDDSGSTVCEVPATKAMVLRSSGQEVIRYFRNDKDTNQARQVKLVRVHPTSIGSVNPTTPVDWEDVYKPALQAGDPDTARWITMAVPTAWVSKQQQGATYQAQGHKLKNQHELIDVLNNFEETEDDTDAVWLDPFSVIVNFAKREPEPGLHGLAWVITFGVVNTGPGSARIDVGNLASPRYLVEWQGSDYGLYYGGGSYLTSTSVGVSNVPLTPPPDTGAIINDFIQSGTSVTVVVGYWKFHDYVDTYDPITDTFTTTPAYYELASTSTHFFELSGATLTVPSPQRHLPATGGVGGGTGEEDVFYWVAGAYSDPAAPYSHSTSYDLDNSVPALVPADNTSISLFFTVPKDAGSA